MKETKKIEFIFNQHPELSAIGTKEQYTKYIKTIFPDSSSKSIFFHGGRKGIESFTPPSNKDDFKKNAGIGSGTKDYGIYFSADKSSAQNYVRGLPKNDRHIYAVMLNMKNPFRTDAFFAVRIRKALGAKNLLNPQSITTNDYNKFIQSNGHDSIVWCGENGETIVFDPKQVHILGSQKDIELFQKYSENKKELTEKFTTLRDRLKNTDTKVPYNTQNKSNVDFNNLKYIQDQKTK